MKKILFSFINLLLVQSAFAHGGYRCEGYCGGADFHEMKFYDAGYMYIEQPGNPELGYRELLAKCQRHLPKNVSGKIYRNVEVTKEESTTTQSWYSSQVTVDTYYGYYWTEIISNSLDRSYHYWNHIEKSTIRVDSLLSTESCHFDSNIQVPTYNGDLPAQG